MTRISKLVLALLFLGACDDNGTVLGSMGPSAGAPNGAGGGGSAAGDSDLASAGADASSGGSSAGSGNLASAGGPPASDGGVNAGEGGAGSPGSSGSSAGMPTGGSSCTVAGDCKSRLQNYQARLVEARLCIPSLAPEPQCPHLVPDICGCMVSVQSLDTACYLEALEDARSCHNCTPEPCPVPTGTCSGNGATTCL